MSKRKRYPMPKSPRQGGEHGALSPTQLEGMPLHRKVGEALKLARQGMGMSLADLERLRGLQYRTLIWSENTRAGLHLSTLVDRCELIGIRPSEVVARAEQL